MLDDNKADEIQRNQTKSCFKGQVQNPLMPPKVFNGRTEKAPHCQLQPPPSFFESHVVKDPGSRPYSYSNTNN